MTTVVSRLWWVRTSRLGPIWIKIDPLHTSQKPQLTAQWLAEPREPWSSSENTGTLSVEMTGLGEGARHN